jgi:hypothetical protein
MKKFLLITLTSIGLFLGIYTSKAQHIGLVVNMRPIPVAVYSAPPVVYYPSSATVYTPSSATVLVIPPSAPVIYSPMPYYVYRPYTVVAFGFGHYHGIRHHR